MIKYALVSEEVLARAHRVISALAPMHDAVAELGDALTRVVDLEQRPSVLFRPKLVQDGNAWIAMYGDLPTGCVGTGASPQEAMAAFDKAWLAKADPAT